MAPPAPAVRRCGGAGRTHRRGAHPHPIERGVWVLAELLGTPPPPPPQAVPALTPDLNGAVTVREMLEKHRSDPACMECHRRMDPLGFALENYGPTGVWRDKYENGRKVDPSGVLFNQHEFKTVVEFKQLILKQKQRFIRGFACRKCR